jgi:DNA polymerase III psi subunit
MTDKIVMIHQPHFLPWAPFFIRIFSSDVYIALDDVKYHKDYYHNRTALFDKNRSKFWITLPVKNSTRNEHIRLVKLAESRSSRKLKNIITQRCHQFTSDNDLLQNVYTIIDKHQNNLCDINIALLIFITNELIKNEVSLTSKILRSSDLNKNRIIFPDRTEHLIFLCKAVHCNAIIMGNDSRSCHNLDMLRNSGIKILEANNHIDIYEPEISILNELCIDNYIQNVSKLINLAKMDRNYYNGGK